MATATAVPFNRSGGSTAAATGSATAAVALPPAESMSRVGLFFIVALSIVILIVAIINLRMGASSGSGEKNEDSSEDTDEAKEKKGSTLYPNKTRDCIILAASVLTLLVSIPSIIATYPKT